jgi:phosphoglycolate phosphatase-like HAD superfamily hydrolase
MQTTPHTHEEQISDARVSIEPGFAWDGQEAYLFDIDGTLLRNRDRIHRDSFVIGVQQVTGFDIQPVLLLTPGGTDPAILREAFEKAGIPLDVIDSQWDAIAEAIHRACEERRHEMDIRIMPGVKDALAHLARKGALLGVATGNLEAIGWIKLEEAGLREYFQFGGFSDHFPIRSELVANAARKAREMAGAHARVCVVGDTPRDIEAARANGLTAIAVATGNFSFDTLLELRPEACASSLADLLAYKQVMP